VTKVIQANQENRHLDLKTCKYIKIITILESHNRQFRQ